MDLATQFYKEGKFVDLVIMDLNMPIMGGGEATKMIKSTISHDFWPHIVALSASEMTPSQIKECQECKFDDWLTAPLTLQTINTRILPKLLGP